MLTSSTKTDISPPTFLDLYCSGNVTLLCMYATRICLIGPLLLFRSRLNSHRSKESFGISVARIGPTPPSASPSVLSRSGPRLPGLSRPILNEVLVKILHLFLRADTPRRPTTETVHWAALMTVKLDTVNTPTDVTNLQSRLTPLAPFCAVLLLDVLLRR